MWHLIALLLVLPLSLGHKVESGCEDWTHTEDASGNEVCCRRCKPGNRLVNSCGEKPEILCQVCENGTYVTDGKKKLCQKCKQCKVGPMRVKQPCTASSDTVCECEEGYLCGDDQCSFCFEQCGKGTQPVDRGCKPCPEGTFNDKIQHSCVNWSSRCPLPGQKIIANGTAFSDIICGPADDHKPTMPFPDDEPTKSPPDSKDDSSWTMLAIVIACAFLIVVSAVPLCIAVMCKSGEMLKTAPGSEEAPEGRRLTPEPEQCSFCFPQEEHGSSSSSEVSLVSDDKPFELVV
ncbi:hypothetical protein SRHO_G00274590 [Serrasalmus rhombeus]